MRADHVVGEDALGVKHPKHPGPLLPGFCEILWGVSVRTLERKGKDDPRNEIYCGAMVIVLGGEKHGESEADLRERLGDELFEEAKDALAIYRGPWKWQRWVRSQDVRPPARKLVLLTLATYAGVEDGKCFPELSTLAKDCGTDKSTICRHLRKLEDDGLIEREQRTKDRVYTSTMTTLKIPAPPVDESDDDEAPTDPDENVTLTKTSADENVSPLVATHPLGLSQPTHYPCRNPPTGVVGPLRQKLPLELPLELPKEGPAEAAALVLEKRDRQSGEADSDSSRPIKKTNRGAIPPLPVDSFAPQKAPPVFRGRCLVVTREQHAKWQARWPDADNLASWYPTVDRECAEQGNLNGEVLSFAETKLDEMAEIPF